jgi:predicted RNA methylase
MDVQAYTTEVLFDLVVMNPPYGTKNEHIDQ